MIVKSHESIRAARIFPITIHPHDSRVAKSVSRVFRSRSPAILSAMNQFETKNGTDARMRPGTSPSNHSSFCLRGRNTPKKARKKPHLNMKDRMLLYEEMSSPDFLFPNGIGIAYHSDTPSTVDR